MQDIQKDDNPPESQAEKTTALKDQPQRTEAQVDSTKPNQEESVPNNETTANETTVPIDNCDQTDPSAVTSKNDDDVTADDVTDNPASKTFETDAES